MSGVRLMVGDFHFDLGELVQQQVWECYGWCNAQTLATTMLQHEWAPTCKQATERDQIWLSPEAVQLLQGVSLQEHFADHLTVIVQLLIPKPTSLKSWPRPTQIPLDLIHTKPSLTSLVTPWNFCSIGPLPMNMTFVGNFVHIKNHDFTRVAKDEHSVLHQSNAN